MNRFRANVSRSSKFDWSRSHDNSISHEKSSDEGLALQLITKELSTIQMPPEQEWTHCHQDWVFSTNACPSPRSNPKTNNGSAFSLLGSTEQSTHRKFLYKMTSLIRRERSQLRKIEFRATIGTGQKPSTVEIKKTQMKVQRGIQRRIQREHKKTIAAQQNSSSSENYKLFQYPTEVSEDRTVLLRRNKQLKQSECYSSCKSSSNKKRASTSKAIRPSISQSKLITEDCKYLETDDAVHWDKASTDEIGRRVSNYQSIYSSQKSFNYATLHQMPAWKPSNALKKRRSIKIQTAKLNVGMSNQKQKVQISNVKSKRQMKDNCQSTPQRDNSGDNIDFNDNTQAPDQHKVCHKNEISPETNSQCPQTAASTVGDKKCKNDTQRHDTLKHDTHRRAQSNERNKQNDVRHKYKEYYRFVSEVESNHRDQNDNFVRGFKSSNSDHSSKRNSLSLNKSPCSDNHQIRSPLTPINQETDEDFPQFNNFIPVQGHKPFWGQFQSKRMLKKWNKAK